MLYSHTSWLQILQNSLLSPHVHSVFLSEGLHLSLDKSATAELPRRFEAGSSKARLTWFGALCLAGIGMFVEAYVIITTGQIKTVWHSAMPTCFSAGHEATCPNNIECCGLFTNTPDTCGKSDVCNNEDGTYRDEFLCKGSITGGISYAEFAGIMLGMLTFGKVADLMGRHVAGMLTASFQIIGIAMMTFYKNPNFNTLFIVFDIFFFVFGFGVGGEYPLTAANAASHHIQKMEEAEMDDHAKHQLRVLREREKAVRRGETISIVFAMQGVGAVTGSVFLLCLIYFGNQSRVDCDFVGHNPAGQAFEALDAIWRSFYFIGMIFVAMMLVYRTLILEEGDGHKRLLARKQRRQAKIGKQRRDTFKILSFYGVWYILFSNL
jgi:MFS family permease